MRRGIAVSCTTQSFIVLFIDITKYIDSGGDDLNLKKKKRSVSHRENFENKLVISSFYISC